MKMKFEKIIFLIAVLFSTHFAVSQVTLPKLISDGMILQRDTKVKIWGWASANENIIIRFNNKTY